MVHMNLLPNFKYAEIKIEKLANYCLNRFHERGKDKAYLFEKILGINELHAHLLKQEILSNLDKYPAIEIKENEFGKKYSVLMKIKIMGKEGILQTGWIIEKETDFPRLTSCYIKS